MTAQFPETIIYQGEGMALLSTPLDDYFELKGSKPDIYVDCTALHRGYSGTWEIRDGKLRLVALEGTLKDGSKLELATLFGERDEPVFADWYSGTLRIAQGELLEYVHSGFKSIYQRELFIEIDKGLFVSERLQHNVRADGSTTPWLELGDDD